MTNITYREANAWTDKFKLNLNALDAELEASVASQVLSRVSPIYDTSSWTTPETTPSLIKSIIAMYYVGWYFERTYSEDTDISNYGILLMERADALVDSIVTGVTVIPSVDPIGGTNSGVASFYPTDLSSEQLPTYDDPSLGGPRFTMGQIW